MLLSIALVLLTGYLLGEVFGKLRLPKLTGMIAAGILLNCLGLLDEVFLSISGDLRKLALVIILLRAGISIKPSELKRIGRPAALMCFLPACFEMVGTVILAPPLLGLSYMEAAVLGSVLGAVSPAVIVPKMLRFIDEGRGTEKLIPQLILAGASMDDVFVIVMFSVFAGLEQSGGVSMGAVLNIPVSILCGAVAGAAAGLLLAAVFRRVHIRDSAKVIVLMGTALLLTAAESLLSGYVGFSGTVAVMTAGIALGQKAPVLSARVAQKLNKMWLCAEIMLFVLVGAAVDLNAALSAGVGTVLLIAGALIFRAAGVLLCLAGTGMNLRERVFCVFAYIPKATVQAAIGGMPLAMGMSCGQTVLSAAVIAILVTAPLGALLIETAGKWLPLRTGVTQE